MPRALRIGLSVLVVALVCVVGLHFGLRRRPASAPACPRDHWADAARADDAWARLAAVPEGAALLQRSGPRPSMCFGPSEPSVVSDTDLLLIGARLEPDEAAARVGHLLSHVVERDRLDPEREPDCEAFGRRALVAEQRAHALEARLLSAMRAAEGSPASGELDTGAKAAAVAAAYLERCRRARDAAAR